MSGCRNIRVRSRVPTLAVQRISTTLDQLRLQADNLSHVSPQINNAYNTLTEEAKRMDVSLCLGI